MNSSDCPTCAAMRALLGVSQTEAPPAVVMQYITQDDTQLLNNYKLSKRAYLESARRNDFPNEKLGRQVRTTTPALEAWLASRTRRATPRLVVDNTDGARQALEGAAARFARRANR